MKQICLSIPTGDQVAQDAKKVCLHNFFFLLQFSFSLYAALIYMVILFMMGFDFIFDN